MRSNNVTLKTWIFNLFGSGSDYRGSNPRTIFSPEMKDEMLTFNLKSRSLESVCLFVCMFLSFWAIFKTGQATMGT